MIAIIREKTSLRSHITAILVHLFTIFFQPSEVNNYYYRTFIKKIISIRTFTSVLTVSQRIQNADSHVGGRTHNTKFADCQKIPPSHTLIDMVDALLYIILILYTELLDNVVSQIRVIGLGIVSDVVAASA